MSTKQTLKAKETCHKCYLLCMLLHSSENGSYHLLKDDLSNNMTKGADNFLKTMVKMMHLLTNFKSAKAAAHA